MTEEEASTYFAKKAELGRNWEGGEEKAGHVLKKKGGRGWGVGSILTAGFEARRKVPPLAGPVLV